LSIALDAVGDGLKQATTLVAHNMAFDEKILGAEFLRTGRKNAVTAKPRLCTMQASTDYCRLPGPYGYKWPSLQELYSKLFNEKFEGAHHAMTDVRACARCYFELRRLKVMG
jgi:DNA polymerase-3 subunit epsilon